MLIRIPAVLSGAQLSAVRAVLADADFVDGKLSAGEMARKVKNNEEVAREDPRLRQMDEIVMNALVQQAKYQAAALPQRIATPFYARYTQGMGYGSHVDDPIMGQGQHKYRSDIAITIFLNEPEQYAGGELVVRTAFGEQYIKYPAGDAVLYPASSLHRVERVTQGERLVAVTWAQSLVRDAEQRELLFDLYEAREELRQLLPDDEVAQKIDQVYVNLVRRWAQP